MASDEFVNDLTERNLRLVLMKAVADAVTERLAEFRDEHQSILLEMYDESLEKAFPVWVGGNKVATITLAGPAARIEVTDEAAFLAWFEKNRPDSVEEVVIPAVPEKRVRRIKAKSRSAYLAGLVAGPAGMAVDPVTDVIVDGVTSRDAGRPESFQIRFTKDGGREAVIEAWRSGALVIAGAEPLPQIEAAGVAS